MRKTPGITVVLAAVALALAGGAAGAQGPIEVARGSEVVVENGVECAPNSDVVVSYLAPGAELQRIGGAVSDGRGHFATTVTVPPSAVLGAGTITVDCDVDGGVLVYDIAVVEPSSTSELPSIPVPALALGAVALLAVVGLVMARTRRSEAHPGEVAPIAAPPAPDATVVADDGAADRAADVPELEPVPASAEHEDDPEYWFWAAETERGPVKRLACLTDQHFFLHEIPADRFNDLLEALASRGPEQVLSRAFFRVAVADIDEVRHRRTEIRLAHRTDDGPKTQTIDLATEVDEVIDLLSRRVPVIAETPTPAPGR